ncbi:acrylate utilization transcriptional regulator AcuR [Corynebacterium sp. AOP40-9SA-29]|uniref:acrylate utilization transcriptional regulator AcuR n=1 Tax=Corynebacterium sp. AOP40-9SA-29 TaxID=3457677 RepID=UPI0040334352
MIENTPPSAPPRKRGRPRKSESARQDTRDLLCRTGVAALTEKGYCATGIDEILTAAGVPKGSFYAYFDSKEAFGAAVIVEYDRYFTRKLDRHLGDETLPALERINAFCQDAEAGMQRHSYRRGCVIGNLGQEMNALPEAYRAQIIDVLAGWQTRVAACLTVAKDNGEIPAGVDCRQSAEAFWIGWEGAVLHAKLHRSAEPLWIFREFYLAGLQVSPKET